MHMRLHKLLIFIFIASAQLSNAQTERLFNPIDKKLNQCLSDSSGVMGQSNCMQAATEEWTQQMEKQYKLLVVMLPKNEKQNLINTQTKWKEYRNTEIILVEKIENDYYQKNQGMLVYPQLAAERKMNIIKTRTLELTDYYNLIGGK